jgi:hypothetical protein
MSALDLNILSLYRINGQEWPQLPGLLALNPPRKTARGRDQDRLLVYLTLAGNVMYSSSEYAEITQQIAERFYATPGSLTFALKSAVEALNTTLVERNMQTTSKGHYSLGALVLAALRGGLLYIVQSGPTHAYWLVGGEARHFNDSALAGKGLGLSQTARMYFAQASPSSGDRLLFCAALPPNWDKALSEERGAASLEATRRRLLAVTDSNVSAVLFQVQAGSGAMNLLRPAKDSPAETAQPAAPAPTPPPAIQPAAPAQTVTAPPVAALPPKVEPPAPKVTSPAPPPVVPPVARPAPTSQPLTKADQRRSAASGLPPAEKGYAPEPKLLITPEQRARVNKGLQATARFLAKTLQNGRQLGQKISAAFEKLAPRLLPGNDDEPPMNLSGSWLGFISIAIPLLVVTVAFVVYQYLGIPQQYDLNYQRARETARQTTQQQNPIEQRKGWNDTLEWLDLAEQYQKTNDSQGLRQQAQAALDALDRTQRVDYKLAFSTTLSPNLRVTRMAASDTDLYLLDAVRGSAIRGALNGHTFDIDSGFKCEPGAYDGVNVGPLVDMLSLPRNNPNAATLLGIDAAGNLLYCIPGEAPHAVALQMPDVGWKKITSIAFDANNLYILDAPGRAVWVYFGGPDIEFTGKAPYFFFESQIPSTLDQGIGIAVNGDDLYLLHADGHIATCTLSRIDVSPTRCTDPAVFIDTRPGYQSGTSLADGVFSQIAFTSPPDPAVALLEPYTQAIFRFSARALELQNQLRPLPGQENPLPAGAPITAMAYSTNKVLFIFAGGQAYFSVNVP